MIIKLKHKCQALIFSRMNHNTTTYKIVEVTL